MNEKPTTPDKAKPEVPPAPRFLLEEKRRLSQSMLWGLQRASYGAQGQTAWHGPAKVPWFVTSNSFVAASYARAAIGFLRDAVSPGAPFGALDLSQPLHIIELCAGSGHFGFLFASRLGELKNALPVLAPLKVRYVMTDLVRSNVDAWARHERMKPLVDQGLLDFATFDLENDKELRLLVSGETLSAGSQRNPVGVIANYAFDSTLQDAFRVSSGTLHEALVSVSSTRREDAEKPDAETLKRLSFKYDALPATLPYYNEPLLDNILERFRDRLGDTSILLPVGALRALGSLSALSSGRLFLLSADKGHTREEEIANSDDPQLATHNQVFSLMVNYLAIGLWFEEQGGFALHSASRDSRLRASGFVLGAASGNTPETHHAFSEALGRFGVYDYFSLANSVRPKDGFNPSLEAVLAMLRLSDFDYNVLLYNSTLLAKLARTATPPLKKDLLVAIGRVWESFYPMDRDLPFELGRVLSALERPMEALSFYKESLRLFGEHEATYYNAGLCLYRLQQRKEALEMLERSLARKPGYGPAREWRNRIEAELAEARR
jgi:tetratricopeptide (TPR) repeat protein